MLTFLWKNTLQDRPVKFGGQMAERLGNRAINQKVTGLISGCVKGRSVPVLTVSRSG